MFNGYNDILTPEDLMGLLSIGKSTLYKLLNSRELQSFKIGEKHKISKQALIAYIIYTYLPLKYIYYNNI